jgi:hypothetical protein
MKTLLIIMLAGSCLSSQAQLKNQSGKGGFAGFLRMTQPLTDSKWLNGAPRLTSLPWGHYTTAGAYWQGSSYTSYSENGRVTSTYTFDTQGQLRESKTSVSLRKRGMLSYWQVQFSPQRSRPLLIYNIH